MRTGPVTIEAFSIHQLHYLEESLAGAFDSGDKLNKGVRSLVLP